MSREIEVEVRDLILTTGNPVLIGSCFISLCGGRHSILLGPFRIKRRDGGIKIQSPMATGIDRGNYIACRFDDELLRRVQSKIRDAFAAHAPAGLLRQNGGAT